MPRIRSKVQREADQQAARRLVEETQSNVGTLLSQHAALAKAEAGASAVKVGVGAGLLVIALFGILFALFFLSLGAWWALGYLVGNAWSGLIIGGVWLVLVIVAGIIAIIAFKRVEGLPRTFAALKAWPAMLRGDVVTLIEQAPGSDTDTADDKRDDNNADKTEANA